MVIAKIEAIILYLRDRKAFIIQSLHNNLPVSGQALWGRAVTANGDKSRDYPLLPQDLNKNHEFSCRFFSRCNMNQMSFSVKSRNIQG
ncbi:MAG: hypothetical protein KDJ99_06260, partial [Candidatus Competibacteraceae bacterium]|nr:hypothetical protein [Candidatus Competibacteraceae bacterium]